MTSPKKGFLIPLPDGTAYNAYLVEGSEKTVETPAGMIRNLKAAKIKGEARSVG